MRIYSYQNPIILDELKTKGVYTPFDIFNKCSFLTECLNDQHGFLQSYNWLKQKMIEKNITSVNNLTPQDMIWGWGSEHSFNAHNLRYKNNRTIYNDHILLELEISEDRLIATCYNYWHSILNNGPIALTDEEYDYLDSTQELKEQSWEKVFDPFFDKSSPPCIQYTFFQILKSDIISIKHIRNMKVEKVNLNKFF